MGPATFSTTSAEVTLNTAEVCCIQGASSSFTAMSGAAPPPRTYATDYMKWMVSRSVSSFLIEALPADSRIESVLWMFEGPTLRVWTVLNEPDREVQRSIYAAEMNFMEATPDLPTDFITVFRRGRDLATLLPAHAQVLRLPGGANNAVQG